MGDLSGWNPYSKIQLKISSTNIDSNLTNFPIRLNLDSPGSGNINFNEIFDELTETSEGYIHQRDFGSGDFGNAVKYMAVGNGRVFVPQTGSTIIEVYSINGVRETQFNAGGNVVSVAVDDTYIYVATDNGYVLRYDFSYVEQVFSSPITGLTPAGIATANNYLFVTNSSWNLKKYDATTGAFIEELSNGYGESLGQLMQPRGVAADDIYVYISNEDGHNIQCWDQGGNNIWIHDNTPDDVTGTTGIHPMDITISDDRLFLAQGLNENKFAVFNKSTGTYLQTVGTGTAGGIAYSPSNAKLFVVDVTVDVIKEYDTLTIVDNNKKIAITVGDGTTECNVEIECWDSITKKANLWIKLPLIASEEDTLLYLYFDKDHVDNTTYIGDIGDIVAQDVWDNNFVRVYHMSQDPSTGGACILDSTTSPSNGTPIGTMTSDDLVDGDIGKTLSFDKVDDYISLPVFGLYAEFTQEVSFNTSSVTTDTGVRQYVLTTHKDPPDSPKLSYMQRQGFQIGGDTIHAQYWEGDNVETLYATSGIIHANTPHDVAFTGGSFGGIIYVDGVNNDSSLTVPSINIAPTESHIGARLDPNGDDYFGGEISEVRISNIARSETWVKATNYSNKDELIYEGEYIRPYLTGFTHRMEIVIDSSKVDADLTDFPIRINLSELSGITDTNIGQFFNIMGANSKKIAVTTYDGVTQCFVEIEKWDEVGWEAELWAKIPFVSSTEDTIIYFYYDADADDNTGYVGTIGETPAQNVWDSNFVAVYHMNQDPSGGAGAVKDSTNNSINGTSEGTMLTEDLVDGAIGKAIDFDGNNDAINIGSDIYSNLNGASVITVEGIINNVDLPTSGYYSILSGGINTSQSGWQLYLTLDNTLVMGGRSVTSDAWQNCNIPFTLSGQNTYTVGIMDYVNDNIKIVVDDGTPTTQAVTFDSTSYTLGIPDNDARIGQFHYADGWFKGIIDEVRISKTNRSDAWLKATYYSNNDSLLTLTYTESLFIFNGYVQVNGFPEARTVYLFRRDTGEMIDSVISNDVDGYFEVRSNYNIYHFINIIPNIDEGYNLISYDKIHPEV